VDYERSVEWVDIRVPKYPTVARLAKVMGKVAIEVRFKGCELAPESPHVVNGKPTLAEAAIESPKTIQVALRRLSRFDNAVVLRVWLLQPRRLRTGTTEVGGKRQLHLDI
jgi:hypothetical protein